jgi:hypothetical protein
MYCTNLQEQSELIPLSTDNEDWITIPLLSSANVPALGNGPKGTKYDWNMTGIPHRWWNGFEWNGLQPRV